MPKFTPAVQELENTFELPQKIPVIRGSDASTPVSLPDGAASQFYDRGGAVYNVRHPDFGAVGDGMTDDTAAIQAALDEAGANGGTVFIPPGTYFCDRLYVPSDVIVMGAGRGKTVIMFRPQTVTTEDWGGVLNVDGTSGSPVSGVTVQHLTIDGNGNAHTIVPPDGNGYDVEALHLGYAQRCTIFDVECRNAYDSGIDIDHSHMNVIFGCYCHGNGGFGIHVSLESSHNRVIANYVRGNGARHKRGGIDQHATAHSNIYIGNLAEDNYRNYFVQGTGARWVENQSMGRSTAEADDLSASVFRLPYGQKIEGIRSNGLVADIARISDAFADKLNRVVLGSKEIRTRIVAGGGSTANIEIEATTEIELLGNQKGIILRSGDGTRWRIRVDNSGEIQVDKVT